MRQILSSITRPNVSNYLTTDIDIPARPDPALNLSDLRHILDHPELLPLGADASRLNEKDYRLVEGNLPRPVRVTVDRDFYEIHADSVEFWTPGSPAFPDPSGYRVDT